MEEGFVDRIYEAGLVPILWPGVLSEFAELAGGLGSVLLIPALGRWIATPAIEEMISELVTSGLISTNPRTQRLLGLNHPGFITDLDVFDLADIPNEPIYRDFFIPRGGGLGVATVIPSPSGDTMILHAERAYAAGPVERAVVEQLDALRPHFARASLLSARLELERARNSVAALDQVGLAAAVLGRGGKVLAANPLLIALMPDVVQDRPSRFALADVGADRLLVEALERLAHQAVRSIPIAARHERPPVIAHLVPIRGAAHDVFASATAIVIVTPVVPRDVPTADVVQGLFDLTPAEARVARAVGAGRTAAEIATIFGTSPDTVRTQMKSILAKTGLHRQAELVALLQGAAPPRTVPEG